MCLILEGERECKVAYGVRFLESKSERGPVKSKFLNWFLELKMNRDEKRKS